MTSRIGQPDTEADVQLREVLSENPSHSFVMVAGAGSGKTTSLIKALVHISHTKEKQLRTRGQRVACITYTEVAVNEIHGDVGDSPLVHVSTIHSFLWLIVSSFQSDLRAWVTMRIEERIQEANQKLANPRTRTRDKIEADLVRYRRQLDSLVNVKRFTYGTGSNYEEGILGHDDILKIGPYLIQERPLMRRLVAARFPIIFVDESQDTNPDFVSALKLIDANKPSDFCLGFFGDPMQKIYLAGAGAIELGADWRQVTKPENFRCPTNVLALINRIRADQDGLEQTRGRTEVIEGNTQSVAGSVRLFVLPSDGQRTQRLGEVRRWLAQTNEDALWVDDTDESDVRVLILVHRMAATRLGFASIYSALNDDAPENLKKGLVDGTAWVLRPFLRYLLPLITAIQEQRSFDVMTLLRANCPRLESGNLLQATATVLAELRESCAVLTEMLAEGSTATVRDVLAYAENNQMIRLDERFSDAMAVAGVLEEESDADEQQASVVRFLLCPATELWGYRTYIEGHSPFATQQGVKGAEFERILVILDDEESNYKLFSSDKYFGLAPLSDTDRENEANGVDNVIGRTSRLFYVCCSRARKDLAVTLFVNDVDTAVEVISARGTFLPDQIFKLGANGGFAATTTAGAMNAN